MLWVGGVFLRTFCALVVLRFAFPRCCVDYGGREGGFGGMVGRRVGVGGHVGGLLILTATTAVVATTFAKYNSDSSKTSGGTSADTSGDTSRNASGRGLDNSLSLTKDASVRGLYRTLGRSFVRGGPKMAMAMRCANSNSKVRSMATKDMSVKSSSETLASSRGTGNIRRGVMTVSKVTMVASGSGSMARLASSSLGGVCANRVSG